MFKKNQLTQLGKWVITSQRKESSPLIGFLPLFESMTYDLEKDMGLTPSLNSLVEFRNGSVKMATVESVWENIGDFAVSNLSNLDVINKTIKGLEDQTVELNSLGSLIKESNLSFVSNLEINSLFLDILSGLKKFIRFTNLINASDFYHGSFTKYLLELLHIDIEQNQFTNMSAHEVYSFLTSPSKLAWIQEEREDLLEILIEEDLQGKSIYTLSDSLYYKLVRHLEKYFWLEYEQEGECCSIKYFHTALINLSESISNAKEELRKVKNQRLSLIQDKKDILEILNLSPITKRLFEVAEKFVYWKLHMREVKVRFYCCSETLFLELGKRFDLSRKEFRHLSPAEISAWLLHGSVVKKTTLQDRIEYSVWHFHQGKYEIYTGQVASDLFSIVSEDEFEQTIKSLNGVCAYRGKVIGRVRQVIDSKSMKQFRSGEILVAYMTDVSVVPAMKIAGAIVTDVGGVTCHASIISREFKVPCVIGTRIGTKLLKDGYLVEVDAENGSIEILSKNLFQDEEVSDLQNEKLQGLNIYSRLSLNTPSLFGSYVITLGSPDSEKAVITGGKGSSLGNSIQSKLPVPPGFCITSDVFKKIFWGTSTSRDINNILDKMLESDDITSLSSEIQDIVTNITFPKDLEEVILGYFQRLKAPCVAVRSSAIGEDSVESSWAGQLESFLNTTVEDLIPNIKKCWASIFSERALVYRQYQECEGDFDMAVVVQKMVNSRISGTAFSKHPVSGCETSVLIESCLGLGETLVLGQAIPTTYIIEKESFKQVSYSLGEQETLLRRSISGFGNEKVVVSKNEKHLTKLEAVKISQLVTTIENIYGFPVDVEWAFEDNQLYLLQVRPITT